MNIYVALRDSDESQSFVIGAFSTETNAELACQMEANDNAEAWGKPNDSSLKWKDAEAISEAGDHYAIVLVDLDTAVN